MARKDYIVGKGNVFEDLGYPRPAEALAMPEDLSHSPRSFVWSARLQAGARLSASPLARFATKTGAGRVVLPPASRT